MKDWHGVTYHSINDHQTREAVATINDFLFQLSPSISNLSKGKQANSSGITIVNPLTDDFLFKPGRIDNQIAFGGTTAGGFLQFFSTKHPTKGEILFGDRAVVFDEANVFMGINTDTPAARLHLTTTIAGAGTSYARPSSTSGTYGVVGAATAAEAIDDSVADDDISYMVSNDLNSTTSGSFDLSPLTNPGVTSSHTLLFRGKVVWTGGITHGITGVQFQFILKNGTVASPGTTITSQTNDFQPYTDGTIDAYQEFSYTLSGAEAATIVDYASLHCQFNVVACVNGGDPSEPNAQNSGPNKANTFLRGTQLFFSVPGTADAHLMKWTNGTGTITLDLPTSITSHTLTWPGTQGAANTVLTNDGSGNLSWATTSSLLDDDLDAIAALTGTGGLYRIADNTWALRTITATSPIVITNGDGVAGAPNVSVTSAALTTGTADTNVTIALGGSPTTALLAATSITVGWTGTLAAARLNSNVVQAVTNDTNVTGSISAQTLTLGWTGTLSVARGGTGVGTLTGILQGNGTSAITAITNSSTTGQVLRVTGVSTYAWGALDLANSNAITGTLPAGNGGTGIASYAVGDILYASASATLSKLADVATGNALISGGVTTAPSWGKIGLTTHISGVLPLANGGSNKALTASNGGIVWTDSDSMEVLAGTATAGQILRSGASATPSWSTATYPATAGSTGNLLMSDGTNWAGVNDLTGLYTINAVGSLDINGGFSCIDTVSYFKKSTDMTKYFQISCAGLTVGAKQYYAPNATPGTLLVWNNSSGAMPATGSLLRGSGATSVMSELTIGGANTILTSDGSVPVWSGNASVVDIARSWTTLQTFPDNTFKIVGSASSNRTLVFEVDSASANADCTISWVGTADRTITLPDGTVTLAGLQIAETFTKTQTFQHDTAGNVAAIFKGTAASSANIVEGRDSAGNLYFSLDSSASVAFGAPGSLIVFANGTIDGAAGQFFMDLSALTAIRTHKIPDLTDSTFCVIAGAQNLSSKAMQATCTLIASTASSGVAFQDTTTSTKKLRAVLSGATGNNSFTLTTSAARNYEFTDSSGQVATNSNVLCIDGDVVCYDDDMVTI